MKEKSKKDNRSLTSLIDELETSINATGDSFNQELIKAIKQRNNENKKVDKTGAPVKTCVYNVGLWRKFRIFALTKQY